MVAAIGFAIARAKIPRAVDPIEANALHGGRMSVRDSLIVTAQTIISNGFGASVGLEAIRNSYRASLPVSASPFACAAPTSA